MGESTNFWKIAVLCVAIAVTSSIIASAVTITLEEVYLKRYPTTQIEREIVLVNDTLSQEAVVTSVFNKVKDSVVHIICVRREAGLFGIQETESTGSGMIIDPSGIILTNEHVVENANEVEVILSNGDEFEADVIGTDLITDIAVIKIDPPYPLKPVTLGDSDKIVPGQLAIAIGNPYVLENTITVGIISAVNRTLSSNGYKIHGVIQTDAAINPGNSGGPLLNSKGEVIGITNAIFTVSGGFQGIGFAIPINTAKKVADELVKRGKVVRPWLGITGTDLTEELARSLRLPIKKGALIMDVVPGGPADKAGLRGTISQPFEEDFVLGDIIVGIDDKEVDDMDTLIEILFQKKVGETVEVKFFREGEILKTKVTLGERPD
jgi:S1-C subfamily serine protease